MDLPPDFVCKNKQLWFKQGDKESHIPVNDDEDAEFVAWEHYIGSIAEVPTQPTPALVRYLCALYRDISESKTKDWGSNHGQRAAAACLHVDERTVRRWVSGDTVIPWAPVQLLFMMYKEAKEAI